MAQLVLTKEEEEAALYTDWDDASLGRLVKHGSLHLNDLRSKMDKDVAYAKFMSLAVVLIKDALEMNANYYEATMKGITNGDVSIGDWKITLKQINKVRKGSTNA